jgi:hypothetical protein
MKALLGLIAGTVAFWALVTYPARLLADAQEWEAGELTLLWSTTAAALCLVPAALTLAWTRWAYRSNPEQQLLAVMGGTAVRMGIVVVAGLVLFLGVKQFAYQRFWIFVILYYLFTLALEMVLILRGTEPQAAAPKS